MKQVISQAYKVVGTTKDGTSDVNYRVYSTREEAEMIAAFYRSAVVPGPDGSVCVRYAVAPCNAVILSDTAA